MYRPDLLMNLYNFAQGTNTVSQLMHPKSTAVAVRQKSLTLSADTIFELAHSHRKQNILHRNPEDRELYSNIFLIRTTSDHVSTMTTHDHLPDYKQ